ncbi:helix-turn-helix domain-containing protein [Microbacterium oleivorans]|uniref:helix-turn-helix domain-containing protein n=1 Tax=Microbacterium oleivorans TaxID=273677 RepID=UPI00076756AE|nr:helix-turn-helix transcriptional regulator [Microbacterium oleivorans]
MAWDSDAATRLGRVLRERRLAMGLTQQTLSDRAGVTKNQIQLIEAGRAEAGEDAAPSNPRVATLAKLCGVFELSVADVLARAEL